jgi:hypothetical protein
MAGVTGGPTSGAVRTFDPLGRDASRALDIEAVTLTGFTDRHLPSEGSRSPLALGCGGERDPGAACNECNAQPDGQVGESGG